jgi:hypothetical protein
MRKAGIRDQGLEARKIEGLVFEGQDNNWQLRYVRDGLD